MGVLRQRAGRTSFEVVRLSAAAAPLSVIPAGAGAGFAGTELVVLALVAQLLALDTLARADHRLPLVRQHVAAVDAHLAGRAVLALRALPLRRLARHIHLGRFPSLYAKDGLSQAATKRGWRTLDVLLAASHTIHALVALRAFHADPFTTARDRLLLRILCHARLPVEAHPPRLLGAIHRHRVMRLLGRPLRRRHAWVFRTCHAATQMGNIFAEAARFHQTSAERRFPLNVIITIGFDRRCGLCEPILAALPLIPASHALDGIPTLDVCTVLHPVEHSRDAPRPAQRYTP